MRKYIITSAIILSQLAIIPSAEAFPFGRRNQQAAPAAAPIPARTGLSPEIQMPGANSQTNANNSSPTPANAAPRTPPAPPASAQERQAARGRDLVAQSTFWLAELQKNNADEEAAYEASTTLRLMGANDRAVEIAAIGIQAHSESGKLWSSLGLSLLSNKQNSEAVQALSRAIALVPNSAILHNGLGIAYDNINRSDLAIASYNDGLRISPNDASLLSNMGLSQALSGNLAAGEATLRRAISIPNAPVQARQNLALIVGLQGRLQEAERISAQDLAPDVAARNIAYLRQMLNGEGSNRWNGAAQSSNQSSTNTNTTHASN